jgi:hypothetical protein
VSTSLTVAPMQWARLKDIADVEPLNEGDADCLAEIRDVLKKHGKLERFGVFLAHKHFDMTDGEILVEETDTDNRVQTIMPACRGNTMNTIETNWMLRDHDRETMVRCVVECLFSTQTGLHRGTRQHMPID